ncbi:tetratricopeptide repeat protein [Psychroserpens sp. Hel_I_66]|uniref:tetratricopeptide repeat protein n=1 Tax=Psychroserpens sp. Hel_I_66 TaxID=1250004 RepID=UPI00068CE77E|nr:hypothetical protein [Psychroserpens sp. Hel_I_66]
MGLTVADTYYLKARGASCGIFSDWDEVCESLNYALSYDENHCSALLLLGDVYASQLGMFDEAFECFDKVISIDPKNKDVFGVYIKYLIWNKAIDRAEKLLEFALTIKEIDIAHMLWLSSYIEEVKSRYKRSLKLLKQAKKHCYNDGYFDFMHDEEKRIKKKIALEKPKKKKSSKSKKKKKRKHK